VIENNICEGADCLNTALSNGMTSLWVIVVSARSVGWGKNEAVTFLYLVPYPSALMCSMQTQGSETVFDHPTDQTLHSHSR